jgi:hypothetical protein
VHTGGGLESERIASDSEHTELRDVLKRGQM